MSTWGCYGIEWEANKKASSLPGRNEKPFTDVFVPYLETGGPGILLRKRLPENRSSSMQEDKAMQSLQP